METSDKITFLIGSVFGNVAYLGIPVGKILFGSEGEVQATILSVIYLLLVLTLGIFLLEYFANKEGRLSLILKNIFKLPLFWSIIFGIIFSIFKIPIPGFLNSGLKMVADTASPVALFALGIFLSFHLLKERITLSLFLTFSKIFFLPAFFFFLFFLFGKNVKTPEFAISILQASMPLAITNFVLAEKYNLNKAIIANAIFFSTLFSLFEIPLIVKILI